MTDKDEMREDIIIIKENLKTLVRDFKEFKDKGNPGCVVRQKQIDELEAGVSRLRNFGGSLATGLTVALGALIFKTFL